MRLLGRRSGSGGRGLGVAAALSWVGGDVFTLDGAEANQLMIVSDPVRNRGLLFDGSDGRWLQCCPVVGRLDDGTVVCESRKTNPQLGA